MMEGQNAASRVASRAATRPNVFIHNLAILTASRDSEQ
jgi:hypothetical protein